MITVCCWKWGTELHPKKNIRFTAQHVNILKNMVKRHLHMRHEFVCITDDPKGIDPDVKIIPLWDDHRDMGGCYVRLKAFSEEMKDIIGPRFVWIDLDVVILKDITPLFMKKEDFVIWGDTNPTTPYNGSMVMMNAGCRKQVWETFDGYRSKNMTRKMGFVGTDQAWIGAVLGKDERKWTTEDGVYSFRCHFKKKKRIEPPNNARIVFFHGVEDPSKRNVQMEYQWVKEHWV
jgi:hypothetical protein